MAQAGIQLLATAYSGSVWDARFISFPRVFTSDSRLGAFHRLVNGRSVDASSLVDHLADKARERARGGVGVPLVLHDTTEYVVSGEALCEGLMVRGSRQMFWRQHAMPVAKTGPPVVYGVVVFQQYIQRDATWLAVDGEDVATPIGVGSDRWFDLVDDVSQGSEGTVAIHVMDREGDAWSLLAKMDQAELSLVVRSTHDRCTLDGSEHIGSAVASAPVVVTRDVDLSRRSDAKRPPKSM